MSHSILTPLSLPRRMSLYELPVSMISIQAHWWAVLLMGIALIMLMAGFIKICSVHTPSSNPKLPPPKPLPGEQQPASLSVQQ